MPTLLLFGIGGIFLVGGGHWAIIKASEGGKITEDVGYGEVGHVVKLGKIVLKW